KAERKNSSGKSPMEVIEEYELGENPIMGILEKLVTVPGVRVNRTKFLMGVYNLSGSEAEKKDIFSQINLEQMDKAADSIIAQNITASSAMAFFLGLPGGIAMGLSIPADVMQNFAISLRLAQQIAYVYGFDDLFENNEMSEESRNTLIAFLGIMFMATGSGALLRAIAPNVGKYVAKQALKKPLTKTVWYPLLKKIANIIASKTLTKGSVAGFASKAIPIVGGVTSAGITVATMIPMANRLKNELRKYYLSEEELRAIEENDKVAFGEKASEFISDVAASAVKTVNRTKEIGKNFGNFIKQIEDKTKVKIEEQKEDKTVDS
ncbi:MAG: hypothetical protein ACK5L3_12295, partial [Oscillospiraceae bacterium]